MKKKLEEETTYEVRLLCRNCETDWIEDIDKGNYVRYEKDNNYMIKADDSYENRKYFTCPKCGSNKKIARLPLT
jgi:Zn finger protein HypA/HybF involved in hydrogenase expression